MAGMDTGQFVHIRENIKLPYLNNVFNIQN